MVTRHIYVGMVGSTMLLLWVQIRVHVILTPKVCFLCSLPIAHKHVTIQLLIRITLAASDHNYMIYVHTLLGSVPHSEVTPKCT